MKNTIIEETFNLLEHILFNFDPMMLEAFAVTSVSAFIAPNQKTAFSTSSLMIDPLKLCSYALILDKGIGLVLIESFLSP